MSKLKAFMSAMFSLALVAAPAVTPAHAGGNLVAVLEAEIATLDPHFTPAYISRTFGFMVFDTLFAKDAKGEIKPQMVQDWKVSPDGLIYTFTLRDGLKWHDGQPVTSADCVASLRRWGQRNALGRRIFAVTASLEPDDAKTFVLTLKEPSGLVIDALGNPVSPVAFMMPERVAKTPADQRITEIIRLRTVCLQQGRSPHRRSHDPEEIRRLCAAFRTRRFPGRRQARQHRHAGNSRHPRRFYRRICAADRRSGFHAIRAVRSAAGSGKERQGEGRQFHRRQHVCRRLSPQRRAEAVRRSGDPARAMEAGRSARGVGRAGARCQIRHTLRNILHLRHHL